MKFNGKKKYWIVGINVIGEYNKVANYERQTKENDHIEFTLSTNFELHTLIPNSNACDTKFWLIL